MARPNKEGLDYFSLDTDITGDDKIKLIKAKHGLVGFAIVILLLTKIYKEGYYYQWSEDEQYLFADDARVDIDTVTAVVNDCINKGFFNQELFQKYGILTSRGIQKRFLQACTRRKKLALIREYFIVDDYMKEVFEGKKIIVSFNSINVDINTDKPELVQTEIPQIEIEREIEKESKEKDNAREDDDAKEVLSLYQNEVGIVSPTVAELLTDANKTFSSEWVKAAIREAVKHNARNWSYIDAILKSWRNNGFKTKPKGGNSPPSMTDEEKIQKFAKPDCPNCNGTGYITYYVDGEALPKVKCDCWDKPSKT